MASTKSPPAPQAPPPEPLVVRLMRRLSKEPTERNRFALYTALLNAELVVPLRPDCSADAELLPGASDLATEDAKDDCALPGESDSGPVFVVFSEDIDLIRWREGGGRRARVRGAMLFPLLAEAGCVALRINPKSRVGGMLYGHEVVTVAEAARRRYV